MATLFNELGRTGKKIGVTSMCVGTGSKAFFWVISSYSRLLFESRDMLQEQMALFCTACAPQTRFVTQILIYKCVC